MLEILHGRLAKASALDLQVRGRTVVLTEGGSFQFHDARYSRKTPPKRKQSSFGLSRRPST